MARPDENAAFGAALGEILERHGLRQADVARTVNVSPAYISRLATSAAPSPGWVDAIATATGATEEERYHLHRAAARGKGYWV